MKPLCAVVMATFDRAHLLARSIECYNRMDFPLDRFELVVVDDHSRDETRSLMGRLAPTVRWTYVTVGPKAEGWRDCAAVVNAGIRATTAEHVILTHPEVLPGRRSVAACVEALGAARWRYACCKPYYLTRRDQERIDTVPWREEGPLAVRKIDGFYDQAQHATTHPDYTPWAVEAVGAPGFRLRAWESWVFGGCSRETWRKLGGMIETQRWGTVDILFHRRRDRLGIANHTCAAADTFVVHCNHDDPARNVPTPRDMDAAVDEGRLFDSATPADWMYPAVDHLGW